MKRYQSTYGIWIWFIVDGVLWFFSMWLALRMRFPGGIPPTEWEFFWRFIPVSGASILGSYLYCGVYNRDISDQWDWSSLWYGNLIGAGIVFGILFALKIPFSRFAFGIGFLLFMFLTTTTRICNYVIKRRLGYDSDVTVFACGFKNAQSRSDLSNQLSNLPDIQFRNDIDPHQLQDESDLPDLIVVNGDELSTESIREFMNFGSRTQIPVRCYPSTDQMFLARTSLTTWMDTVFLRSEVHYRIHQQMAVKAIFDYLVGGFLLLTVTPLMLLIAVFVVLFDGFPVLYTQERTGRRGRKFTLYKFRTMVPDADKEGPALTQGDDDPRITSIGRFLRRWSLDELPQLYNVIKGDMSLVGPRPEIPSITEDYESEEQKLLWLKPGLTGLSQVSGRQKLDLDKKLEIDKYYLMEYSIFLDFWIMLKTIYVVFTGKGAT